MPIPQTASILKSYFQTGDFPTEAQFVEFIDTMYYLAQQANDDAAAAAACAPDVFIVGKVSGIYTASPVVVCKSTGISLVERVNTTGVVDGVKITFDVPFASVDFALEIYRISNSNLIKNVNYLQFDPENTNQTFVIRCYALP